VVLEPQASMIENLQTGRVLPLVIAAPAMIAIARLAA